ncbi:MAG: mechanosensitive ion channel family protein [Candidatus Zixiibacteriota bacterium]
MDIQALLDRTLAWLTTSGLRVILVVILALVALRVSRWLSRRLLAPIIGTDPDVETQKRADTLASLIRYALTVAILSVALMMVLGEFGIELGPILAAAGIVGLAVGFGAQQLVQDVISGFFILMEDQIRVGDVVNIAGKGGLVEKVTLRATVLRDLAGNVHYVRNGQIDVVTNMTKEYSQYVFDIGVAYREDIDEVVELIKQVDDDLRADKEFSDDILEPIEILGLDQFADSAVIIKARTKTKPIKQWRIGREFNRRLKKIFDEKGIEIPFPHVTLYMGEDKQGQAPPLRVVTSGKKEA